MSASLVGSEMCIRDRPWLQGLGKGCITLSERSARRVALVVLRPRPRRDCLLYTSDAADDM
eukprot:12514323-Alexandrium_andersonii.AAC.1